MPAGIILSRDVRAMIRRGLTLKRYAFDFLGYQFAGIVTTQTGVGGPYLMKPMADPAHVDHFEDRRTLLYLDGDGGDQ